MIMSTEKVAIAKFDDWSSGYMSQRLIEAGVKPVLYTPDKFPTEPDEDTIGLMLSGSPASVLSQNYPTVNIEGWRNKVPLLAICYGCQLVNVMFGGEVGELPQPDEALDTITLLDTDNPLFVNLPSQVKMVMAHQQYITKLAPGAYNLAQSEHAPIAAYQFSNEPIWGIQFHPSPPESQLGDVIYRNFLVICREWKKHHQV